MKLKEIHLNTDNLEETAGFYADIMGLPVRSGNTSLHIQAGETLLVFNTSEKLKPVYHIAFDVPNNKLEEAHSLMKGKVGILFLSEEHNETMADFSRWNAKSFYFRDNNGNILEYITRYDRKKASDRDFDGLSILNISEIGLVTDDVPGLASEITEKYGVKIYPKQPPQEHFTVMGDEEGLFILAASDRDWFPSTQKASSFPTKIIFEAEGQEHILHREKK
ncbi:VOC family protein [Sinomicrobium sp. M5D2P9]